MRGVSFFKMLRLDQTFRTYSQDKFEVLMRLAYGLNALISIADVTQKLGYTIPEIRSGPTRVHAKDLSHPQVKKPVANAMGLEQETRLLEL